jgi:alpha-tubulin suppressor-like RCC1 family protein
MRRHWYLALALGALVCTAQELGAQTYPDTLRVRRVSVGRAHACVITLGDRVACWGANDHLQAGAPRDVQSTDLQLLPIDRAREIAAGGRHSCALDADGAAWCWGANDFGQLGDGRATSSAVPRRVDGGFRFTAITTGGDHTCALTAEGRAYCWGDQWDRAAGSFDAGANLREPYPVKTELRFTQLSAGGRHTCGLTADGAAYCWGNNSRRQIAESGHEYFGSPHRISDGLVRSLVAGTDHTCALGAAGDLQCSHLRTAALQIPPVEVAGAAGPRSYFATAGRDILCIAQNRTIECRRDAVPFTRFEAGTAITELSIGPRQICAVTLGERLRCWVPE